MKKSIQTLLLSMLMLCGFQTTLLAQKTLYEGTVVRVRLVETLDSRTASVGDIVTLEVADPVSVDGTVVVELGAKVTGKVLVSEKNKNLGRKGKLDFSIDFAKARDGQNVPLSSNVKQGGKDATVGVVAAAAIINPLALFIKGKAAVINKGTEFNCYVERNITINVK